jgi:hypothetical protein
MTLRDDDHRSIDDVRYSLGIYPPSDQPVTASAGVFSFPER